MKGQLGTEIAGVMGELGRQNADSAALKSELLAAIASAKLWALLLYIALAAGLFGTMARGFGWI